VLWCIPARFSEVKSVIAVKKGTELPGMQVNKGTKLPGMQVNKGTKLPGMQVNKGTKLPGMQVNKGTKLPGMQVKSISMAGANSKRRGILKRVSSRSMLVSTVWVLALQLLGIISVQASRCGLQCCMHETSYGKHQEVPAYIHGTTMRNTHTHTHTHTHGCIN
jgi:hypothetical protein